MNGRAIHCGRKIQGTKQSLDILNLGCLTISKWSLKKVVVYMGLELRREF